MSVFTLINVSVPEHDHDAANKLYVDRRSGGTDKVSRKGDTMQGDLDMSGYRIAGLNTSLPPRHTDILPLSILQTGSRPSELAGISSKQASSFFNKNLTNADNDNSMNMSTKMEMSQVNKPANNVQQHFGHSFG